MSYIILGLSMLIISNFAATFVLVLFYFRVAKIDESLKLKAKLAASLSASNAVVQLLGLVIFSATGMIVYTTATFLLAVIAYSIVMKVNYKCHVLEIAIISLSLATILNPFWISLLGII